MGGIFGRVPMGLYKGCVHQLRWEGKRGKQGRTFDNLVQIENEQDDEQEVLDMISPREPIPDRRNKGDYNCKVEFIPRA